MREDIDRLAVGAEGGAVMSDRLLCDYHAPVWDEPVIMEMSIPAVAVRSLRA